MTPKRREILLTFLADFLTLQISKNTKFAKIYGKNEISRLLLGCLEKLYRQILLTYNIWMSNEPQGNVILLFTFSAHFMTLQDFKKIRNLQKKWEKYWYILLIYDIWLSNDSKKGMKYLSSFLFDIFGPLKSQSIFDFKKFKKNQYFQIIL